MRKLITILACLFTLSTFAQSNGDPAFFYYVNPGIKDSKTYASLINDGLFATNNVGGFGLIAKSTFLTPAQGNAAYSLLGHTHAAGDVTSGTIATARLGSGTANSTTFLRGDQTWQTISAGSGDVVGPASSVADNIALFDGITGKLIKDAGINLSEVVEEDPGAGIGLIESGVGVSPIILKNIKDGLGTEVINNTGSIQTNIHFSAIDQFHFSDISGDPLEATVTSFARSILDDANAGAVRTTIGAGTGNGDALVANPLSQFAATTSAQLAGVLSDETGTGVAVFSASPALTGTPTAPTASAGTNTTQAATTAFVQQELALQNPTFLTYSGGSQVYAVTSLADVNSTTFTFPSTGLYHVRYAITNDANATTTGPLFAVNGTAVFNFLTVSIIYSTLSTDASAKTAPIFDGTGTVFSSSLVTSNNRGLVDVWINVTTVGTILLRAASEVVVANAITITNVTGFMKKESN